MQATYRKAVLAVSSAAMLLALGACGRNDERTVNQKMDTAVSKTDRAGADAKRNAGDATASAGAAARHGANDTKAMGASASDKVDADSISATTFGVICTLAKPSSMYLRR